jgi:predicted TPR repeat methyltransferase/Tfp pilus assembly protein PilF
MSTIALDLPGFGGVPAVPLDGAHTIQRWRENYPALKVWLGAGASVAAALRRLGLMLWSAKRLDLAAQALSDAAAADPLDAAVWLDLGFCLRALGEIRVARDAFVRATQAAPHDARAWLALGLAAKEVGDPRLAEDALTRATLLDPGLDDAAYALGVIHFEARRYADAATHWRGLAARGYKTGLIRVGLGQCLFFLGEFAAAAESLGAHLAEHPDDEAIARRYALVCFLEGALRGGPEEARRAYAAATVSRAGEIEKIAQAGFLLLASYGHVEASLAVARAFARPGAPDPIDDHHMAALTGAARARASGEYVTAYFDRFADTFDDQMAALGYKAPERMVALLDVLGAKTPRGLDLGCGSGAAVALLRPRCEQLCGVDLSTKMIDRARARELYDELVVADMGEFLANQREAYDLVFAADSLIYVGDLKPVLHAAARALAPGGYFVFSLETTKQAPYVLQSCGRFAHAPEAVIATAADAFELSARETTFLRLEANQRIYGELIVLARR